ncbi:MAG: hypothetical protein IJ623_02825 [Bacteroidales bacterium]|nr:hypothetical protein [Bacteroidales bacterium]
MAKGISSWLLSLSGDREQSLLGKERFIIFMITSIALIVINIVSVFTQPLEAAARISAIVEVVVAALLVGMYFWGKIHLRAALTTLLIVAQLQNVVEIFTYAHHYSAGLDQYFITDFLTSILLVMTALVTYLRYSPTVLAALSLFSYTYVLLNVESALLSNLFVIYLFILVAVILYDSIATRTTLLIDEEKVNLTEEFTAFMKATGISRDDIKGYSSLSRNFGASTEQAREILMSMKPWAQHNLVSSVDAMLREEMSDRTFLKKVFPGFTETQISIAQLIIQGKRQTEICLRLGKSESNISAQRSNMRSKLELRPEDNLHEALISIVRAQRGDIKK